MALIVFEDERCGAFSPLSTLRHVSLLYWGTRTLLDSTRAMASREVALWGREELRDVSREREDVEYNAKADGETLLVNASAKPDHSIRQLFERTGRFVAKSGEVVIAARIDSSKLTPGVQGNRHLIKLTNGLDVLELPHSAVFHGCWELVGSNGLAITEQAQRFPDQPLLPPGVTVRGPASNLIVHETADIEGHVFFDVRRGPVILAEGALVESFSRVSGPCFIGPHTRVHSALLREGTSLLEECRIGGEVENSIVMPHSNKSHYGYVGDSIVGEWVNLGAGSTFSNLKNTYGSVKVEVQGKKVDTGMIKYGPVIGDMAKVSIGCMIYSGKTLGVASHVSGLIDKSVPGFTFCEGGGRMIELLVDAVIETQARMMERRGKSLTKSQDQLIRRAYSETRVERRKAHVRRGRL